METDPLKRRGIDIYSEQNPFRTILTTQEGSLSRVVGLLTGGRYRVETTIINHGLHMLPEVRVGQSIMIEDDTPEGLAYKTRKPVFGNMSKPPVQRKIVKTTR